MTTPMRPVPGYGPTRPRLSVSTMAAVKDDSFVIEIVESGRPSRRFVVDHEVIVGREAAEVNVADSKVSRRHVRFGIEGSGLVVEDLGSPTGTRVNGVVGIGPRHLTVGDEVGIGDTRLLVVGTNQSPTGPSILGPSNSAPEPPLSAAALRPVPVGLRRRTAKADLPSFPNYTQLPRALPVAAWHPIRAVSVAAFLGLIVMAWIRPTGSLFFFWRCVVPVLPVLFFVAPGLWRNICPLAAANQAPRLFGFTRDWTVPSWLKDRAYLIAITLFLVIVPTRKVLFNTSGPALSLLLVAQIVAAFVAGVAFKGKSGWCSSMCPLLPVQRIYGQTPFVRVANSHCQPCVGCTKNCYDFNPGVAYQADLADPEPIWSQTRKLFAGAFPGVIVGFFAFGTHVGALQIYGWFAAAVFVSIGIFFLLDASLPLPSAWLAALWGAGAFNLFYWYQARPGAGAITQITGVNATAVVWPLRAAVLAVSLVWFWRTIGVERRYSAERFDGGSVRVSLAATHTLRATGSDGIEITFVPNERRVVARAGQSLLEVIESAQLPIEVGCRMGLCGADPVAIVEGMDNLSPAEAEEETTLRRLGLAANTRLACCAQIHGAVKASLVPEKDVSHHSVARSGPRVDPSVRRAVVIGGGISGVTAADFVRRQHPDCEIHLIGREPHPLYNRMGISRLIHGRSAMHGLYLLDAEWYSDARVNLWRNTHARHVLPDEREVVLGTGERLGFDRLVLATGSSATVPPIPGIERGGAFVLREAIDAMAIRSYVHNHGVGTAVVAGAGLLGLEAAHALWELGITTIVVDRAPRLLARRVDERASHLLEGFMGGLGVSVLPSTEVVQIRGDRAVREVVLSDGSTIDCGLLLVCAGISPNTELAAAAGLAVSRGIEVDRRMATSVPGIYAAGDCAELAGEVVGLWSVAVGQAEVAATNLVGGDMVYAPKPMPVILKGAGIELVCVGRQLEQPGDVTVILEDGACQYRKLVISADGTLAGAMVLGRPDDSRLVMSAVQRSLNVETQLDALRAGEWSGLHG